jgi:hypothetical protein
VPERERAADCKLRRLTGEGKVAVEMPEICLGSDSSTDPAAPGMLNTEEIRRRAMKANQNEAESSPSAKDLVVFEILRDSKCTGCGQVIRKGEFLFLDGERALCLSCADFDHLEYPPR